MSKIIKSIKTEISLLTAKGRRKGMEWRVIANGYEISFWGNEDVLDVCDGDGSTTLGGNLKSLNCILKKSELYAM